MLSFIYLCVAQYIFYDIQDINLREYSILVSMDIKVIIFILLLIDSVIVCALAWLSVPKFIRKFLQTIHPYFPITKGWALGYLMLVLWIGYLTLYR